VGDQTHLDYLYVLTVADVRGTNPKMWNSWKDSLFSELYHATRRALRRGVSNPIDKEEFITTRQVRAAELLKEAGLPRERWQDIWASYTEEYFLRHRPEEIAWHTRLLAESGNAGSIIVDVDDLVWPGLTSIAVYSPRELRSFVRATAVLDELGLTIVDARIVPLADEQALDTYCVLEIDGSAISDRHRLDEIRSRLLRSLTTGDEQSLRVTRRAPRQVRMFSTPVQVATSRDPSNPRTIVELVAGDRPGLLFEVAKVFDQEHVALQNAKIATIGERAEDVFFVTNDDDQPLDEASAERLGQALRESLTNPRN
jgi:[protein-PII] uridylyltransferase